MRPGRALRRQRPVPVAFVKEDGTLNELTRRRMRRNLIGYAFVAPNFAAMLLFAGVPILMSLPLAFAEWNLFSGWDGIRFIGLDNFRRMPGDIWFVESMRNTLVYTFFIFF